MTASCSITFETMDNQDYYAGLTDTNEMEDWNSGIKKLNKLVGEPKQDRLTTSILNCCNGTYQQVRMLNAVIDVLNTE